MGNTKKKFNQLNLSQHECRYEDVISQRMESRDYYRANKYAAFWYCKICGRMINGITLESIRSDHFKWSRISYPYLLGILTMKNVI